MAYVLRAIASSSSVAQFGFQTSIAIGPVARVPSRVFARFSRARSSAVHAPHRSRGFRRRSRARREHVRRRRRRVPRASRATRDVRPTTVREPSARDSDRRSRQNGLSARDGRATTTECDPRRRSRRRSRRRERPGARARRRAPTRGRARDARAREARRGISTPGAAIEGCSRANCGDDGADRCRSVARTRER